MDEKSTRNSEKVKDVEVVMIERSIQMKEETKTKNTWKARSLRKAHFEKAQSEINRKLRVKNLCCNNFVVFLKCTLEKGLGGFQHIYYQIIMIHLFTYIMFALFLYCHVVQNNTCVENISNHVFFRNWIDLDRMSNFFTICPKDHLMSFLTASWHVANILSFDPGIASGTVEMNIGHLG